MILEEIGGARIQNPHTWSMYLVVDIPPRGTIFGSRYPFLVFSRPSDPLHSCNEDLAHFKLGGEDIFISFVLFCSSLLTHFCAYAHEFLFLLPNI